MSGRSRAKFAFSTKVELIESHSHFGFLAGCFLSGKIGLPITRSGAHSRLSVLRLVNLVENPAVVEIGLLSFSPTPENVVDGKQLDLRKLLSVFFGDFW
jgi:hypothetical protein